MANESTTYDTENNNNHHHHEYRSKSKPKSNWSVNKLFWGLLLVLIGALMLASNFGLVDVKWSNIWRLWPLIVISAGLSVMSFKNILWQILMVLLVIISLAAITWVVVGDSNSLNPVNSQQVTISKLSEDVKHVDVSITAGASVMRINSSDQAEIIKAKLESNVAKIAKDSTQTGNNQQISIYTADNSTWWAGNIRNNWDVKLTRALPVSLTVNAGASDTQIDTTDVRLDEMNVKAGASSLVIKLGNRQSSTNLGIDSGASSVVVKVPKDSGVKLKIEGGLASKQLSDLSEISKDKYQSANAASATSQVNITAKVGVSSFTIERY